MDLQEQLTGDLKASMQAGDSSRTGVIRLLRGALKNEEIKLGHVLSADEVQKVVVREAKQRRDAIAQYREAGRPELAVAEETELSIIETYLPKPLSDEELQAMVEEAVARTGAESPAQMGRVVGEVMKRAGARADGGRVAAAVKARLAG